MMDRRRFFRTVGASLLAVPRAVEAQPAGKMWRLGYLFQGEEASAARSLKEFLEGLREFGYVEGKTLKVEMWVTGSHGHEEKILALAAEMVQTKPDLIVVGTAGHAAIVQRFTKTLPIVTLAAGELVQFGLAASLARPGGNVTGMQVYSP